MSYILGIDPSLKKTGFVILDIKSDDKSTIDRGLLKTSPDDGILVQRLIKQANQVSEKIDKYNIRFIGMEAPFFDAFSTEKLFALNQFLHLTFLKRGVFVVCFPPQQLKKLVFPDTSVHEIGKPHMIHEAKSVLNLHGKRLAEDVADAYWSGVFGKRFYKWFFEKSLQDSDLGVYENKVYSGSHTYIRGKKKGTTDYTGIIYRENELFFDFEKIKRRKEDGGKKKDGKK